MPGSSGLQKLRMRRWAPGDELAFAPRADFAEEARANGWDWKAGAPGPTWTIYRWSGEVVGIGGAVEHEAGRWQAWAQLAANIRRGDWPQLLWLAGRVFDYLEHQRGAARIEAHAHIDRAGAAFLLRKLSFHFEELQMGGRYLLMVRGDRPHAHPVSSSERQRAAGVEKEAR